MKPITVNRAGITAEEVAKVLTKTLGSRFDVLSATTATGFGKPVPADANMLLVKGNWLERASVQIATVGPSSELRVAPGATYPGLIRFAHRIGLARKVHQILESSPDLATAGRAES